MASTRTRNGRIIALYRDAQGRQKSAGTFPSQTEALKAAKHAEALTNPPAMVLIYSTEKRGKVTVAGYGPGWLEGHRLEASSREGYGSRLKDRLRRVASRQGLRLSKSPRRDVRALDYGRYHLVNSDGIVFGGGKDGQGYCATLDDIEAYLNRPIQGGSS